MSLVFPLKVPCFTTSPVGAYVCINILVGYDKPKSNRHSGVKKVNDMLKLEHIASVIELESITAF